MKVLFHVLVVTLLLVGAGAGDDAPRFKVTTRKADDKVEVQVDGGQCVIAVKSASGIGSAAIERTEAKWPATVLLKLHLKGLESFAVSNGKTTINAAVSRSDGKLRVRLWKDDKEEEPLDPKSPHWMEIRAVGADGKPTQDIPLKDGYFEMTLPREFLEGAPKSIALQWIDFYRG
ncbi:MAG: hypothetical protein K2R98_13740 [Gemmataceae bacterium]|nr:hypothetical protein [Gemmataceae bacterium]